MILILAITFVPGWFAAGMIGSYIAHTATERFLWRRWGGYYAPREFWGFRFNWFMAAFGPST